MAVSDSIASWGRVAQWTRDEVGGEPWPVRNPLRVIPIVPLVNRPRLAGTVLDAYGRLVPGVFGPDEGQSEIAMVMSNQDAINKLLADMMVAAEFGAFRQRYIISQVDPGSLKNAPNPRASVAASGV